jgi:hypothetical protein
MAFVLFCVFTFRNTDGNIIQCWLLILFVGTSETGGLILFFLGLCVRNRRTWCPVWTAVTTIVKKKYQIKFKKKIVVRIITDDLIVRKLWLVIQHLQSNVIDSAGERLLWDRQFLFAIQSSVRIIFALTSSQNTHSDAVTSCFFFNYDSQQNEPFFAVRHRWTDRWAATPFEAEVFWLF